MMENYNLRQIHDLYFLEANQKQNKIKQNLKGKIHRS